MKRQTNVADVQNAFMSAGGPSHGIDYDWTAKWNDGEERKKIMTDEERSSNNIKNDVK